MPACLYVEYMYLCTCTYLQDCTIHVGWHQSYINEEAITTAFRRFGEIQTVTMDKNKKYAKFVVLLYIPLFYHNN